MNFELSEDQSSILTALDQILAPYADIPVDPAVCVYAEGLAATLAESGFLDLIREPDFGPLDAALLVERVARAPQVCETAATALIAPAIDLPPGSGPVAIVSGDTGKPVRYLSRAGTLIVLDETSVAVASLSPDQVEDAETLLAYPYGRLKEPRSLELEERGDAGTVRRRWRIGLAAEAAGCMASALDAILEHVQARFAFGRPLGSMQAIQHRLAMAEETAQSTRWLAFRAAWTDDEADAALAAGFAQDRIARFTYDLHQFAGAMGLTLEFPLHLWTYRLRALASDLGGASMQARAAAHAIWGED